MQVVLNAQSNLKSVRIHDCRAWQDWNICKIVKIEVDPLLAARNINVYPI